MSWWAWIILGVVLLVAEVIIAADFYLVFFGVSAFVVGLLVLAAAGVPVWVQWLLFAILAIVALVFFRRRLRAKLMKPEKQLDAEIIDEIAIAKDPIDIGAIGQVELRGTVWQAYNEDEVALAAGERCRVIEADGLTLRIRKHV